MRFHSTPIVRSAHGRALLAASCALATTFGGAAALGATPAGTLYLTESVYAGKAKSVTVGQPLPNTNGATAIADGSYPGVFANDSVDGNFGITSPIILESQPAVSDKNGVRPRGAKTVLNVTAVTGIATSFSSKSELAVHLSTDGSALTFMGYKAALNVLDVSNANTPGSVDPTNSDTQTATYRSVVQVNLADNSTLVTDTDAYSGNNGRGAILAKDIDGSNTDQYLLVGNAGNGSGTPAIDIVDDTGVQGITPGSANPFSTVIGVQQGVAGAAKGYQYGFSVALLGDAADKSGKDDNFRGATVFNNQLYVTKGSGGNGVNTVYQVTAPHGGLPLLTESANSTISILPGFPTNLAADIVEGDPTTEFYPFDIFFANATTLYVADEGSQDLNADPNAGLQKWIFNGTNWTLAYVIQAGLNLDQPYTVANYPSQYDPATTGLRHIAGAVTGNVVTIFATTSTYSSLPDPGADPNQVVRVVDQLDATALPQGESFTIVRAPISRHVYRGVGFKPAN
jgi:hypothetical protein